MPTFDYKARNQQGVESGGVIVAESVGQLREQLRAKGLYLTGVGIVGSGGGGGVAISLFRRRPKLYDMVVMSRQLATLVRAGVSAVESLEAVADQTTSPVLAEALMDVRAGILTGDSMSQAMAKHPRVFSEMYCALVSAGEQGGTLEDTLEIAADQLDKQQALREQVKSAMIYPIIVITAALLVISFVITFLVPVFKSVYVQFGQELPGITKFMLFLSDVAIHWWYVAIPLLIVAIMLVKAYVSTAEGREVYDAFKLRIPFLGALFRKIGVAEFTQTFAGMIKGGVPIIGAMQVAADTSSNVIVRNSIWAASESIKEGASLATALVEAGQFPPMVTRMVASGEKSGNLDEMLAELTRFYERDIEHTVARLARTMEPVMTVVVGGIVLFTLLALYMPIFMLSQVIKR